MPGKHVHFDDVHTPLVPHFVPSRASSSSTASSSPEPMTPPPLGFGSPYNTTPLPGNACVHPIFREPNFTQQYTFDISKHYSSIIALNNVLSQMWRQPASMPEMPSMTFICDRLPWTFTVVPGNGNKFVTVGDVFEGLYTALRKGVTAGEFQALSISEQTEVTAAYTARCKYFFDNPIIYEQELSKGVKRVDFLGKHPFFARIKFVHTKGGRWLLCTKERS